MPVHPGPVSLSPQTLARIDEKRQRARALREARDKARAEASPISTLGSLASGSSPEPASSTSGSSPETSAVRAEAAQAVLSRKQD
jgi:hypothetical protein